ncbi:hypothetical protein [Marinobacter salicampi]|uniref:hypothetical protein n=1 Tax=Marinobacter salicampi TaxID=435907 RepID=UPI0014093AFA|nr:hypothetical protein [Marinobacter salicampi]
MEANAAQAREVGVPKCLVGQNGDLFMIKPVAEIRRNAVATGRLGYNKGQLKPIATERY